MRIRCFLVLLAALVAFGSGDPGFAQDYGTLPDSIPDGYEASPIDRFEYEQVPNAVVRLEARRLVVEDTEKATLYTRKVVTVFDESGRHHGRLRLTYDSFVDIEDLDGRILDANGNTIKELDDEYITDRSAIGRSLYNDVRVRIAELFSDGYPYTVEYRYKKEITIPMRWPTWYPEYGSAPLEFGQFEVDAPPGLAVRYTVRGDSLGRTVERDGERRRTRWRVTDRPSYHRQPRGPSWDQQATSVHVAPTKFETAGTTGDMSTWSAFGAWYHDLKQSRDELPAETASEVHRIVSEAPTKRDSVRRLYRHLQRETRYVSVQLGIGGWQPYPASYVQERGYGDCKALTNYMEASLEEVGITAHPVLINSGIYASPVLRRFPSNQFDHVVLAVPTEQDTLWLESTDTTAPFGHVGATIEDRYGLMATREGGQLVRTPASRASDNRQVRTATVTVDPNGHGTASVHTTYMGNQQDRIRLRLVEKTPRERRTWLRQLVDVPNFNLESADFSEVKAYRDTVHLPIDVDLPRYASKTGSRLFLPLNLMQRQGEVPPKMGKPRTQSIRAFAYPFVDADSIRYRMPAGYAVEALPEDVSVETDFASYEASVERARDVLIYRRRLEWRKETLPPDQYEAYREFLIRVAEADGAQAVLVERES